MRTYQECSETSASVVTSAPLKYEFKHLELLFMTIKIKTLYLASEVFYIGQSIFEMHAVT